MWAVVVAWRMASDGFISLTNLLFVTMVPPHIGGPMPLMHGPEGDSLYKGMAEIPAHSIARPTSILIISAHWEEETVSVSSSPAPAMLFDYYGFPPQTYSYSYPAPGNPELAARVADLISTATGQEAKLDPKRGYDHGGEATLPDQQPLPPLPPLPFSHSPPRRPLVFVPLLIAYPEADVPVCCLSLKAGLDPSEHIQIGEALTPLRDEGVLIVGSGVSFHNMREFDRTGRGKPKGVAFDTALQAAVQVSV